jgi:putative iron-dependent peroxidase
VLPPGIFALGFSAETSVELVQGPAADPARLVSDLARFALGTGVVHATNVVVGFRPRLWAAVRPEDAGLGEADFRELRGDEGVDLPATQRDAWVWITGASPAAVFDTGARLQALVEAPGRRTAEVAHAVAGFSYHATRDLTGFEDGTENPTIAEAVELLPVPAGSPGAGGTCVLLQSWLHDGGRWGALDDHAQERVIGRTKPDSIEYDERAMPADAHVPRTKVHGPDGAELAIFRRNSPFGTPERHGTLFIGFGPDWDRMTRMLEQMVGADPGGVRDALTRYATAVSGAHYFVPSLEALRAVAGPDED